MSSFSDELLSAYLDGEADPRAAASIEKALRSDGALAARLVRLSRNDRILRDAIDVTLGSTPPEQLAALRMDAVRPAAVSPFPAPKPRSSNGWTWALPVAAALVIGSFAGQLVRAPGVSAFVTTDNSGLIAGPRLAEALSTAHSGEPKTIDGGVVQVALSFQARDGRFCRQFSTSFKDRAGIEIACRDANAWRVETWTSGGKATTPAYQTAAGPDDPVVSAELQRLGVERTLDRSEESSAIAAKWSAAPGN